MLAGSDGGEEPTATGGERLKVVYLSHASIPSRDANAAQIVRMCAAMVRQSVDVVLYCRRRRGSLPSTAFDYYGIEERFDVRGVWRPAVPMLGRLIHAFQVLARLLLSERPSLYYGRDPYALALVALCPLRRAPIVLEVHRPPAGRIEALLFRILLSSSRLTRVVVISEALARELGSTFGDPAARRTIVARDGADPIAQGNGRDAENGHQPSRNGGLRIGYVGSLAEGKGVELIARLAPLLPDCTFHVVGGAPDEVEAWRLRRLSGNLEFDGFLAPSEVRGRLGDFDVLLAPYQERVLVGRKGVDVARWMSPLKLFEYMAAGKPIVASDLPVLREFLEDGRNALLATADDEHAWAERIRRLQAEPRTREELGERARRELLETHSWDRRARLVLGLDAEVAP